jgi:hypothetical protein
VVTTKEGLNVNVATGVEVTKADYAIMKKKGSQDLYDNYYYKKVYTKILDEFGNRIPLKTPGIYKKTGEPLTNYYYKLINVYGDGPRAVEYNSEFGPSVINNGSMRIKQETSDQEIVNYFAPQIQPEVVPLQKPSMVMQSDNIQKILSGEKTSTLRTESFPSGVYNFGGKDFQVTNRGLLNVQEAGGVEAINKSEAFAETGPKYPSTKDFLEGKRKLYVYDISPVVPLQEAPVVEEEVSFTESLENEATRLKQEIDNTRFDLEQLSDTMPEMIVANNFNKISPESANRETGLNTGNKSDISTSLLSSRGVSVEKAAENIWDDNFAENPIVDVQDVRNIIIDILSSGSIKNYKESILENSTIKELKQQYNAVQEKIKAGKEINKEAKEKLKASQMSLFDKYAPEGLPKINRTPKQC